MRQLLSIMLVVLLSAVMVGRGTKTRTKATVNKEKTEINAKINQTQKKIESNKANTAKLLTQLNTIQAQIQYTTDTIRRINHVIDSLTVCERVTADSIVKTESQIGVLDRECGHQLRQARRQRKSLSGYTLLLSSSSLNQALKRAAYVKQLNRSIVSKSADLSSQRQTLIEQRDRLAAMRERQQALAQTLNSHQHKLAAQQTQTTTLVDGLKRESQALAAVLDEQRARAKRLDNELNAIIAEERRRAEEQRLAEQRRKEAEKKNKQRQTANANAPQSKQKGKGSSAKTADAAPAVAKNSNSFAANKGRLMFPVNGNYTIIQSFGINKHANLPYVHTDNAGIDIKATGNGSARAVFAGTVSSIFYIEGYQNVVMVRHGEYLTVYAGIGKLSVKKGDKVTAGQTIGQIHSGDNGAVLHFEVRRETQKLNPLEWVRR